MYFNSLFEPIPPEKIGNYKDIFGKDFYAITAGKSDHYNSMIGSGGGFGVFFRKPCTCCIIRTDRYTLELILKERKYTLPYFRDSHREKMLYLGTKSGRDSYETVEAGLKSMQTPSGNISFEEAGLTIECSLTQITIPDPDDFCTKEAKAYSTEAYKQESD